MLLLGLLWRLSSLFALPIYVCVISTPACSVVCHVLVSSTFCFLSSAFLGAECGFLVLFVEDEASGGSGRFVGVVSFGEGPEYSMQCFGEVPVLVVGADSCCREVSAGRLRFRQWVDFGRGLLSVGASVVCM